MTQDASKVQNGLNLALRLLLRSPFVVFGAMIMAFTVDSKAAVTFAVVIPLLSLVVFGIMFGCIPLYKKVRFALDKVLCTARESLTGAKVIRAFCKEEEQIEEFKERNDSLNDLLKEQESQLVTIHQEQTTAGSQELDIDAICKELNAQLSFEGGINTALVATILDKIIVKKESTKEEIHLDIHLKQFLVCLRCVLSGLDILRIKCGNVCPYARLSYGSIDNVVVFPGQDFT
jgi:ABC-type multidrug transport system fused ATPase/permease subunit